MNDTEKQIVEQVAGASTASVELTVRLVIRLVNLKKLDTDEAAMILGDMKGHFSDLQRRNAHLSGMAHVFGTIVDRLGEHLDQLNRETGAEAAPPPQAPN